MTLNDLEPEKKKFWRFFFNFWLQRTFQECDKMAKDRRRQSAYKILSIKRRFYNKFRPFRFNEACARERQKGVYFSKKVVILSILPRLT